MGPNGIRIDKNIDIVKYNEAISYIQFIWIRKLPVCHPFEKLAYGMGKFCIYFLVFVHKFIINFVRCVYKVDLDTTRKMSKL